MYKEPDFWYPYPEYTPTEKSVVFINVNEEGKTLFGVAWFEDNIFTCGITGKLLDESKIVMFMAPSDGSWNITNHIRLKWHIDDVLSQAADKNVKLTEEEAFEILNMIKNNADSNYGVSWETIDAYIDDWCSGDFSGGLK